MPGSPTTTGSTTRAPDFARTVDIHRKPGYDPVELFLDPAIRFPKLKIAGHPAAKRILGFRALLDVIPDATLVHGSHGRPTVRDKDGLLFMTPDLNSYRWTGSRRPKSRALFSSTFSTKAAQGSEPGVAEELWRYGAPRSQVDGPAHLSYPERSMHFERAAMHYLIGSIPAAPTRTRCSSRKCAASWPRPRR